MGIHVNDLLKLAVDAKASDLHIKVGSYPMMRVRGSLVPATEEKRLDHEDTVSMAAAVMSTQQRQKFKDALEIDLAYSVPGLGRFRCNVFQQRGTIGLVLRIIPVGVKSVEDLGLPQVLKTIAEEERGLVLVTGTTGSGKSTSLAALVDHVNYDPLRARRDRRRPHRVPASRQPVDRQPARGLGRYPVVRARPAQRAAPGPRRHPRRRNARLRDHRDGAAGRRNRPPRVLDAAHPRRHRDHQPHHRGLSAAPAEADPHAAGQRAEGRHLAAPAAPGRWAGPRRRRRSDDHDAVHPRLHRGQGKDPPDSRRPLPPARRSTACRPSTRPSSASTSRRS